MRGKLFLLITVVAIVGVLVLVNALTYVGEEERHDSEYAPNRSSYHAGPTGLRAFYDYLSESGYKVMRWRDIPERLLSNGQKVETFVIAGRTKLEISKDEAKSILLWVERGGRLVLVDRKPATDLLPVSGEWKLTAEMLTFPGFDVDPGNTDEMTANVKPIRAVQPTLLSANVDYVMPSRFAGVINFAPQEPEKREHGTKAENEADDEEEQPPAIVTVGNNPSAASAPVVHLSDLKGALLVDYAYGRGRIVVLADPFIFSNVGIPLRDNLQLAINTLRGTGGLIAFDEFHQGRGTTSNALLSYFSGTSVLAIFAQLSLLALVIVWSYGRRFARPLPLAQIDRRSSLEFVASMAEVHERARAFDLALENIYSRTRRVLARYAGVDYNSSRTEIASRVAARSSLRQEQLETVMRQCEDAINGQAISERQTLFLARRLREIENALGLRMRFRETKQIAQSI